MMIGQPKAPALGNGVGGGSSCHGCCCICKVPRERERKGKERGERRNKNNKTTKGPLVIKPKAFFLCFLNTSKIQGLGPIWVELPKEFYMKNKC
jgi:hypothetical protein